MAKIVLGAGTSHSPMLCLTAEQWSIYAQGDYRHGGLVFPPEGWWMRYEDGLQRAPTAVKEKPLTQEVFQKQVEQYQRGIAELAKTFDEVRPDVTVIISDDQDEWFFEDNMPSLAVYWGEAAPMVPQERVQPDLPPEIQQMRRDIDRGQFGDRRYDVPVAKELGRHVIEHMVEHDFDIAHFTYLKEHYGGRVARRYPTPEGENDGFRETQPRIMGLPHGFSFVVHRIFQDQPWTILPVFQNTCYPPNSPTPKRSYNFGRAIAEAIESWDSDARVAVIASGGLSHFVVDEEVDWATLKALEEKDSETLMTLPRHRLYSAASETQNWVAVGGAMERQRLQMELIEYIPVYRTPAGTGGGWAFARWQ